MILFYKNTADLTTVEEHLLKLIAPKPTNAYMSVRAEHFKEEQRIEDVKVREFYRVEYFLPSPQDLIEDVPIGHWVACFKDGVLTKLYFPEIKKEEEDQ